MQNRRQWTIESAKAEFQKTGLILDEDVYVSCTSKMACHDKDGYKYTMNLSDLVSGRYPTKIHQSNPFSLWNIQHCLDKRESGTKLLSTEYHNSKEKLKFQCACGNTFVTTANEVFQNNKTYCNFCAKSKRYDNYRDYYAIILDECKERDYQLLTTEIRRSTDDFEYICNKHSEFGIQHSYYDRFINLHQGCYYCGVESRGKKHRLNEQEYKLLAESKGFQYCGCDYRERPDHSKKAILHLICQKHVQQGVQYIDFQNLKRNSSGCVYCNGQGRTLESLQKELDEMNLHIRVLRFDSYSDVDVECTNCGYQWTTLGVYLTQGHKCPCCRQSRYELIVEKILKDIGVEYLREYSFADCRDINPLPFDFYLKKLHAIIEVDGEQHFYPIQFGGISKHKASEEYNKTLIHDLMKNQYCQNNGIPILRIPFDDFMDENDVREQIQRFVSNL